MVRYIYIGIGVTLTVVYCAGFIVLFSPLSDLWHFLGSAPYNERGDFLAGAVGPMAFFWLVIGYFLQSHELALQRNEIEKQTETNGQNLELQKRKLDPLLSIQIRPDRRAFSISNPSELTPTRIIIFLANHTSKTRKIVSVYDKLPSLSSLQVVLDSNDAPLSPDTHEILVVYDTAMDDIRAQTFQIYNTSDDLLAAWRIGPPGPFPEWWEHYA